MKQMSGDKNAPEPACRISGEQAAELMFKASKVSAWLTAVKKKSELRPQEGVSEDASVTVTICNHRIVSIRMRKAVSQMSIDEISSRICEAQNDAMDKVDSWVAAQCDKIARTFGIGGDLSLPF